MAANHRARAIVSPDSANNTRTGSPSLSLFGWAWSKCGWGWGGWNANTEQRWRWRPRPRGGLWRPAAPAAGAVPLYHLPGVCRGRGSLGPWQTGQPKAGRCALGGRPRDRPACVRATWVQCSCLSGQQCAGRGWCREAGRLFSVASTEALSVQLPWQFSFGTWGCPTSLQRNWQGCEAGAAGQ